MKYVIQTEMDGTCEYVSQHPLKCAGDWTFSTKLHEAKIYESLKDAIRIKKWLSGRRFSSITIKQIETVVTDIPKPTLQELYPDAKYYTLKSSGGVYKLGEVSEKNGRIYNLQSPNGSFATRAVVRGLMPLHPDYEPNEDNQ